METQTMKENIEQTKNGKKLNLKTNEEDTNDHEFF